jgi:hypothetical protein
MFIVTLFSLKFNIIFWLWKFFVLLYIQDPDPDLDPHSFPNLDPDPHKVNGDPKHSLQRNLTFDNMKKKTCSRQGCRSGSEVNDFVDPDSENGSRINTRIHLPVSRGNKIKVNMYFFLFFIFFTNKRYRYRYEIVRTTTGTILTYNLYFQNFEKICLFKFRRGSSLYPH